MTFHVKGNPAGYLDSVGAFHLKIDTIKGPDGKKLDLKSISKSPIFRFTPIFTTDNRKSGEVLFRLTTIEPHGLLFSKKKPLGTDSLVKYAGEFRDTIRLPLTDEVLTDIYKIIDIIQKFIFSFNTGASAAEVGGGGGGGGGAGGAGGAGGGASRFADFGGKGFAAFVKGDHGGYRRTRSKHHKKTTTKKSRRRQTHRKSN